jgi:hypothetical protein
LDARLHLLAPLFVFIVEKADWMLVYSVFVGSFAEFIRHAGGSIPETLGLVIFGMVMFLVSTGIRRREALPRPIEQSERISFKGGKPEKRSVPTVGPLCAHNVKIPEQLASL